MLGGEPHLTRRQVAERVGVPLALAEELWHRLGFPHHDDDDVAFTEADVEALSLARDLVMLGILDAESQAALVRTWGRSFARLAEWQTDLLARRALDSDEPDLRVAELTAEVLPRLEVLQSYIWRRHLVSAANRMLTPTALPGQALTVGFVDIVGYTTQSRNLSEAELVAWVEGFEDTATTVVTDHAARVIKTIGDEILYVTDDPVAAVEVALILTERGADPDDPFPPVRAGLAHGEVVVRLGDVYGSTVNVAARLTSLARPGTVVVDEGLQHVLVGIATPPEDDEPDDPPEEDEPDEAPAPDGGGLAPYDEVRRRAEGLADDAYQRAREALSLLTGEESPEHLPYRFRKIRRTGVKGFPGLRGRVLRRAEPQG
nr:adenylate/guanylate cyclase domain-containing protein [Nocardioides zeae]